MPRPKLSSPHYHAYLVRLWREDHQRPWRASAQSAFTQQVHHFASVEALYAFLDACLVASEPGSPPRSSRDPPLQDDEDLSP